MEAAGNSECFLCVGGGGGGGSSKCTWMDGFVSWLAWCIAPLGATGGDAVAQQGARLAAAHGVPVCVCGGGERQKIWWV
jgi:hypothetical protein